MTRKKVRLAYITNDAARKATFKKRKRGLLKKVSELHTLCGVDACAIIFSPYDSLPDVWPSVPKVQRVISQFKVVPEADQNKKMSNQEIFLTERIAKANEQLRRQRKENRQKEITLVMFESMTDSQSFLDLNVEGLTDLDCQIEQNLNEICKRIETLSTEPETSNVEAS